jgi:hypothetical protein
MSISNKKNWFKELDISLKGKPTGIGQVNDILSTGACYCIISNNNGIIEQVDVYKDGQKIHYKKFRYDNLGRVIENAMYSPDDNNDWHILDDVWHYKYSPKTGL